MKYSEMIKFMNDNGILLMQPLVADAVDTLLPLGCNISDDEYEEICDDIFTECLGKVCDGEEDIWDVVERELVKRGYREV